MNVFIIRRKSVSYTHLDVYKRQPVFLPLAEFLAVFAFDVDGQLEQRASGHTNEKVYWMKAGERIGERCAEIG